MLKVIDLVYYSHNDYDKPQPVLKIHAPATGFAPFLKNRVDIQFVKHLDYEGTEVIDDIKFSFFKKSNSFWNIPFKTNRYIKSQQPDIVIVEGLIFPLQVMMLKFALGKRTKLLSQHHGEKPFTGIKGLFQKLADRYIDAYLFTSGENAREWINKKVIKSADKCMEVLEASTSFTRQDKIISAKRCGMSGSLNFLWVGGLDKNKDPFTVLKGFEKFCMTNPGAKLHMIFQQNELLDNVKKTILQSDVLKLRVVLIGKIDHNELPYWFSAADFYLSGSHKEGSGYALLEAMACGCIPVVTDIPSFRKITGKGEYGFLYPPGNASALAAMLLALGNIDVNKKSSEVQTYFLGNLSFINIANDLCYVFNATIDR